MKTKNLIPAAFTGWRPSSIGPQRGFTLVEVMVALTIGLIILAALAQLFASSRATSTAQNALARVQENARFAMEFISQDLRMAGYAGCSNAGAPPNDIVRTPDEYQVLGAGLRAYRHTCTTGCTGALTEWQPTLPASFGFTAGEIAVGSDVILVMRAERINTTLSGNLTAPNAQIQVVNTPDAQTIDSGDVLIITDCSSTDVFRAQGVSNLGPNRTVPHPASQNTTVNLSRAYLSDAELMRLVSRVYFVGPGTDGRPALQRKEMNSGAFPGVARGVLGPRVELVAGIESMKAAFGVDTDAARDGIPNRYVPAESVLATAPGTTATEDWFRVSTVRIGFVVQTEGQIEQQRDTSIYHVLGLTAATAADGIDDFNPVDDRRQRRVFHETIRIRNR